VEKGDAVVILRAESYRHVVRKAEPSEEERLGSSAAEPV
jgi:hypothetical protein